METPQAPTPEPSPGSIPAPAPPVAPAPPPPAAAPAPSSWETPPLVAGPAPGYEFGGFGERLIAYIVDILIVTALIIAIAIVGGLIVGAGAASGSGLLAGAGAIILILALLIVPFAYFPYFWAKSGQTPGMKALNLRVVRDSDGGPISGGQAVLRLIGYWVSSLVLYLGYIWIFIDSRRRGWHDLIAGTVVVKKI